DSGRLLRPLGQHHPVVRQDALGCAWPRPGARGCPAARWAAGEHPGNGSLVPPTPGDHPGPAAGHAHGAGLIDALRLVSYNIRFGGRGRDGLIADVLGKLEPDLIVLEEATDTRVVDSIAGRLGMREVMARPDHSVAAIGRVHLDEARWQTYRRGR